MSAKDRSALGGIWDFFCSLKLTIVTLILLALTSIIGTVIQQNRSPQEYLQQYSESTYRFLDSLQVFDMYHSWWFLGLLALFSINLIACSIKRLPRVVKTVNEPVLIADDNLFRTFSNVEEHLLPDSVDSVRSKMEEFFAKNFAKAVVTEEDGKIHLFADKGVYSRYGVYVTHLSILLIFIGAIVGTLFGYKAYVNIVEGTATTQVWPRGSQEPLELGFSVGCDAFSVSYYEGTGRPREFKSLLTVTDGGEIVHDKRPVIVNDPLSYKGITFYQSSYGPTGDPVFKVSVKVRATGETQEYSARKGLPLTLPGGATFRVADYAPSYQNYGPATRIEVFPASGKKRSFITMLNYPQLDAQRKGEFIFSLLEAKQKYYTGLQVAKDPGVWIVWAGCTLMILGSLVAFFMSHRRIWVTIQVVGGKTGVKIGGSANRNQPGFELFFDDFKKNLRERLGGKES